MNAAWNSAPVPSEARVIANLRQSNDRLREALQDETRDRKRREFARLCQGALAGAILATGAFVASAAWAGDTADFGGTGCSLVPVTGQAHVAELQCRNVETAGRSVVSADLTAGGLTVLLVIQHGPGNIPDHFTATAPGYYADPATLILNEWTSGTVRLFEFVGS